MAAVRDNVVRVVPNEQDTLPLSAKGEQADRGPQATPPTPSNDSPEADVTARRTAASPAPVATDATPAARGKRRRRIVLSVLGSAALAAIVGFGSYYVLVGRYMVTTDDAYVRASNTTIGTRVAGHIQTVAVNDNARVKAGDLLVKIDDGDYKLAVEAARGKVSTQEATLARVERQIEVQGSTVEQARAQLASADAAVKRAAADFDRQQDLSSKGIASKATFDLAQATRDQAAAQVRGAQAAFDAAQANVDVIKAQRGEAAGQLQELKTALAKAERDLSFTTIRAPVDGVFANRIGNAGDFVQPGQRLGNVVPLDGVYIDANFKETQLNRLRPGQHVIIKVDAIKDREIIGIVESVSPATGAVFSLLPPDNATGNFTKIVQRIPVRIRVPADVAKENLLRAGMSVEVEVDTRTGDAVVTKVD